MPNATVAVPSLTGGVSTQPDHQRLIDQVGGASNAVFDVTQGIRKRPGTQHIERIESLEAATETLRLHAIDRSPDERYILIIGDGVLIVRHHDDGEAAVVDVSDEAQAYLDYGDATADDFSLLTIADYTLICNRLVPTAFQSGMTYATTTVFDDWDELSANTPADGTFHEAEEDTPEVNAGFWLYDVDGDTFPTAEFATTSGSFEDPQDEWNDANKNPGGFKVAFRKLAIDLTSTGVWTASTKRLVKAGAFASWDDSGFEQIKITAGTGAATGWYGAIKIDDDTAELATSIGPDATDIQATEIGGEFDVIWDFPVNPKPSMVKVAEAIQDALRSAGAQDALVSWTVDGAPNGYFTITGPWRGSGTTILSTSAPSSGYNYADTARPFNSSGWTVTAGLGTVTDNGTLPVESRWTRVAASGAVNALPDPESMPVAMRRTRLRDGTRATKFVVDTVAWDTRTDGTQYTNPGPRLIKEGLPIADMAFHRNRLVLGGGEYVSFSAADDLFNFYVADASNPTDADPIDIQIGNDRIAEVNYLIPFRKTLAVFTRGGQQFELSTPETLTPSTAAFTATTMIDTMDVRPCVMNDALYFLGTGGATGDLGFGAMFEYVYDDLRVSVMAEPVSSHVRGLVPAECRTMVAHPSSGTVVILPDDTDNDLVVYATYYQNGRRAQSAWGEWAIKTGWEIRDIAVLAGRLYLLAEDGDGRVQLMAQILDEPATPAGYTFYPHIDCWSEVTGVHSLGTTTWTYPSLRQAVQAIVLENGTVLNSSSAGWTAGTSTVAVTGDYSGQAARLGYTWTFSVDLTRPYTRDEQGKVDLDDALNVLSLTAMCRNAGSLTLTRTHTGLSNRTTTLSENPPDDDLRRVVLWSGGDAERCVFSMDSTDPRPVTVTGLEWAVNVNRRNG